jgi:DNA-binding NarL/FixJ family response regulator
MDSRVIIADDHPVFRAGLKTTLKGLKGYDVVAETADGKQTLAAVERCRPDLLLLDIEMPGLNGLDVLKKLKDTRVPVACVCMTMHKGSDLMEAAFSLGARGYLLKDAALSEIGACLKAVLAGELYTTTGLDIKRPKQSNVNSRLQDLTPSERKVLSRVSENRTSKEIADELGVSVRTIETHRSNICGKLGLHGVHTLVKFAFDNRKELQLTLPHDLGKST